VHLRIYFDCCQLPFVSMKCPMCFSLSLPVKSSDLITWVPCAVERDGVQFKPWPVKARPPTIK